MGKSWRRFSEGVRQKLLPDPSFPSTPNDTVMRMLYETEAFARHLRNVNNHLKMLGQHIAGLGVQMKAVLQSPIPRVYHTTETGNAAPDSAEVEIFGSGVQIERITTTSNALHMRLHEEVHLQLDRWLKEFESVKILLKYVEQLRLELDSRKRTVLGLKESAAKTKRMLDRGDGNGIRAADKVNNTLRRKEEKCENCKAEFDQQEENCVAAFRSLLRDLHILQTYLAEAYRLINEMSYENYESFTMVSQGHYATRSPNPQSIFPAMETVARVSDPHPRTPQPSFETVPIDQAPRSPTE